MADIIRVGMIGCDTSHCPKFTHTLHENEKINAGGPPIRVVACYPSFSPDIESSRGRVEQFKKNLVEKWNVRMVDSIEAMLDEVDVVMLESVDGRRHLKELRPVAAAGKPCYIDKPFAAGLADAKAMVKLIKETRLPCFSSSSLRFDSAFTSFMADEEARGKIIGCDAMSPAHLEPTNRVCSGTGFTAWKSCTRSWAPAAGACRARARRTPTWRSGYGVTAGSARYEASERGKSDYAAMVLAEKTVKDLRKAGDFYDGLSEAIATFFRTRKVPVPIDETLEICAFIDAAYRSAKLGGDDVAIDLEMKSN